MNDFLCSRGELPTPQCWHYDRIVEPGKQPRVVRCSAEPIVGTHTQMAAACHAHADYADHSYCAEHLLDAVSSNVNDGYPDEWMSVLPWGEVHPADIDNLMPWDARESIYVNDVVWDLFKAAGVPK